MHHSDFTPNPTEAKDPITLNPGCRSAALPLQEGGRDESLDLRCLSVGCGFFFLSSFLCLPNRLS